MPPGVAGHPATGAGATRPNATRVSTLNPADDMAQKRQTGPTRKAMPTTTPMRAPTIVGLWIRMSGLAIKRLDSAKRTSRESRAHWSTDHKRRPCSWW